MRVVLLSTCAVPVPPTSYGGTELVVAELAKMLARLGHDVTVFATGDSTPAGSLRWHFRKALWPPDEMLELRHSAYAWRSILSEAPPFDIVHVHQAASVAFSAICAIPVVLTLHHERVDRLIDYYLGFPEVTYVGISRRQIALAPELDVRHVVHHGLDPDAYQAGDGAGGWLAFVGRFAPEKGPHAAIDVATAVGLPLRMGGRPHGVSEGYFRSEVLPRLASAGERVRWQGEVSFGPKLELLGGALATLFPIAWEEPFGLVMIESMLVGTPVIAFARGAAPEVIEEGVTGFVVHDPYEMADCVRRVGTIDRDRCRRRARERWSSLRMAREYERVYEQAVRGFRDRHASWQAEGARRRAATHAPVE